MSYCFQLYDSAPYNSNCWLVNK